MLPDRAWGDNELALRLPVLDIRLRGLSRGQRSAIRDQYAGYVSSAASATALECRALRADDGNWPAMEALTLDGQYAPQLEESGAGTLRITGLDFEALCELDHGHTGATLSTACEHALARPLVLENLLRILSARTALARGGLLLHSAGVVVDGAAWLFVGASNAGKTTLSRKADTAGYRILSDDMNLVLPAPGGYRAHAVPFTGEFGRQAGTAPAAGASFPLAALVFLEQAPELARQGVSLARAVAALIAGAPFVNTSSSLGAQLDDAAVALAGAVPCLRLRSARGHDFEQILDLLQQPVYGEAAGA